VIRRTTLIVVEIAAGILGILLLVVGLGVWRLSSGPVELNFLTPYLVNALNPPDAANRVEIEGTVLTWAGWEHALEVHARNVRLYDSSGAVLASAPELNVDLSLRALADGMVAPTGLDVVGARLTIVRDVEGKVQFGFADGAAAEASSLPAMLRSLLGAPDRSHALGYLESIRIRSSSVTYRDMQTSRAFEAKIARARADRDAAGLKFAVALELLSGERTAVFEALGNFDASDESYDVAMAFKALRPALLSEFVPGLEAAAALDLPLDGRATFRADRAGTIPAMDISVSAGAGQIVLPEVFNEPVEVREAHIEAKLSEGLTRGETTRLTLALAGPTITISRFHVAGGQFTAEGKVDNVAMGQLDKWWPVKVAAGGRKWVLANIREGFARQTTFTAHGKLGRADGLSVDSIKGDIAYDGLSVRYMPTLPLVRDVRGTVAFDQKGLNIAITGGVLKGLSVAEGLVRVHGLETPNHFADIDVRVVGPIRDAMEVVDHDPLGYARKLEINPADLDGVGDTRLKFHIPLLDRITMEEIGVAVDATLSQFTWRKVLLDRDVTNGSASLKVDNKAMLFQGTVSLAGAPLQVRWVEAFVRGPDSSRIEVSGVLNDQQRSYLGMDVGSSMKGPVGVRLVAVSPQKGVYRVTADLALNAAELAIPELAWRKAPGADAKGRFSVDAGKAPVSMLAFDFTGAGLSTKGQARLGPQAKGLKEIAFDSLVLGRTSVKGTLALRDGGYAIQASGPSLDISGFLGLDEGDKPAEKPPEKPPEKKAPEKKDEPPFDLKFDVKTLWIAKDRALNDVKAALVRERQGWRTIDVNSRMESGKAFRIRYGPSGGSYRELYLDAEDAGDALKTFGIAKTAAGGKIEMSGRKESAEAPLKGTLSMGGFRVRDVGFLARLLSAASLTGIVQSLSGEGVVFDRFKANFSMQNGVVDVKDGNALTADLGFTFEGKIDLDQRAIDMKGLVIPAYTVNSIIGKIPVLGDILTGGDGGGLFAATFSMTGSLDDPSIGVNPLSVLTPGFLRHIFSIFEGGKPGEPLPPLPGRPGEN
jgi:hypothetical protein